MKQKYNKDEDVDPIAHTRLLNGINSLSKSQQISKATRNEPAVKKSEFHLVKNVITENKSANSNIQVNEIVNILKKTAKNTDLGKLLTNVKKSQKTLVKPLEKVVADRLQRSLNYGKTKSELYLWDPVVTANNYAAQQVFPLQYGTIDMVDKVPQKLSQYRVKSDLMVAMEELDKKYKKSESDDEKEDDDKYPLTLEEMKLKSQELARQKLRESYKAAKGKRNNKIKSKKYHKLLKREKVKQQIKDFEALQKSDPEAAMKQLEMIDKQRLVERATLRHKNTGTWAKNLQIRAKYDMNVRKDLAQQLALSRELTQKQKAEESSDSEPDEPIALKVKDDEENPWVKPSETTENAELVSGYRKYWETRNKNEKNLKEFFGDEEEEDEQDVSESSEEDEAEIQEFKQVLNKSIGDGTMAWVEEDVETSSTRKIKRAQKARDNKNIDDIFNEAEYKLNLNIEKKLKKIRTDLENDALEKVSEGGKKKKNKFDLSFKAKATRPDEDTALIENGDEAGDENFDLSASKVKKTEEEANINPNKFVQMKPKHLLTSIPDMIAGDGLSDESDNEDDRKQKMTIAEAFEDDDIVADFMKEKEDEKNKNKLEDIDLTLPGWGSWGGSGVKTSTRKKMIFKMPKEIPRRDDNKEKVMLNEDCVSKQLKTHLVSQIPFPFTSVKDYESSIRAPIGRTFVPETAHSILTRPSVVTKMGSIIEPMKREILMQHGKSSRFQPKPEQQFKEFLSQMNVL